MKPLTQISLLCFLMISSIHMLCAYDGLYNKQGSYIELGGRANPDAIWGEVGLFEEISDELELRGGFSFLASESFEDIFTGCNLGLRCSLGTRFSPFIGAGVFAGYSEEVVSATNDNTDNDSDGLIDESGETKTIINDVIASVYPEVGFYCWLTEDVNLSISGKYHVTTEGRGYDFWIFSAGFNFSFE